MRNIRIIGCFLALSVSLISFSSNRGEREVVSHKKNVHSLFPGVKAVIAAIGAVPAAYVARCVADFCSMRYFDSITQLENDDCSHSASLKHVIGTYLIACFTGLPIFATYLAGVYALAESY